MGRTKSSGLNFDVDIPGLDSRALLLDPVNGPNHLPANFSEIPWDSPEIIWNWIIDYVMLNRLEQAFASSFEALGTMAVQPCWSSLEACQWQASQLVLVLGQFSPTRARIRANLTGEYYNPDASAKEFMFHEVTAKTHFLVASAMTNYYMWYGAYSLLHNEARSRTDWRSAMTTSSGQIGVLMSPMMRAATVSTVTGREYTSAMSYGCGVYLDTSEMADVKSLGPIDSPDGSVPRIVQIDALYAPVSGCLMLGTYAGDLDSLEHLKSIQNMPTGDAATTPFSVEELTVLANTYRLYGHDVVFRNLMTGEDVLPWASSRECIIEPASIGFKATIPGLIFPVLNVPREGRTHVVPGIMNMLRSPGSVLTIARPTISVNRWQHRRTQLKPYMSVLKPVKIAKFLIKAPLHYSPVTFTARNVDKVDKAGFRLEPADPTPSKPEGKIITEIPTTEDVPIDTTGLAANVAE
jgi:hypothetical protein